MNSKNPFPSAPPKPQFLKLDGQKILVWLTNTLALCAISFIGYFFIQFRAIELKVNAHDAIIVDVPNLRQREAATEKEIADLRADQNVKLAELTAVDNTKLGMEEHLRFRDQMEQRHIENLKAIAEIQTRMADLPKEFPPPWFLQQFAELRESVKVNGQLLADNNVRLARLEEKLNNLPK